METSRVSGMLKDTGWRWLGGVNYSKGVEVGMVLHIDGLVQDCSNSSELTGNGSLSEPLMVNAVELLLSCTKLSICLGTLQSTCSTEGIYRDPFQYQDSLSSYGDFLCENKFSSWISQSDFELVISPMETGFLRLQPGFESWPFQRKKTTFFKKMSPFHPN